MKQLNDSCKCYSLGLHLKCDYLIAFDPLGLLVVNPTPTQPPHFGTNPAIPPTLVPRDSENDEASSFTPSSHKIAAQYLKSDKLDIHRYQEKFM